MRQHPANNRPAFGEQRGRERSRKTPSSFPKEWTHTMNASEAAVQASASGVKPRLTEKTRRHLAFYLFISPWFLVFLAFGLYPLLYGLYLSFTNYVGFNIHNLRFVGWQNYSSVFRDTDAMYALGRTLLITAIYVPLNTLFGLLLAMALNRKERLVGMFRAMYYLPSIVPVVSVGLIWKLIYAGQNGILNVWLHALGLRSVNWLGYDYATGSLLIVLLWGAGSGILINLAGLKGISGDLYEAAAMDGAGGLRKFRHITLPMMTPVIFYNVVMGTIHGLQLYLLPILLSGSELLHPPIRPNYLYVVHAFQQVFAFQRYAYGMALLWVMFVVIILLTVVVFATSRLWVHYETEQE